MPDERHIPAISKVVKHDSGFSYYYHYYFSLSVPFFRFPLRGGHPEAENSEMAPFCVTIEGVPPFKETFLWEICTIQRHFSVCLEDV